MLEEEPVKIVRFGERLTGGEVFYHQRDNSDAAVNGEDDGYIMTSCHDWKTDKSHLMVWDAKTLEVVTNAELDQRVPNGFHSFFIHESEQ